MYCILLRYRNALVILCTYCTSPVLLRPKKVFPACKLILCMYLYVGQEKAISSM